MSNWQFPTENGTRGKHGPWDICVWMDQATWLGRELKVGYSDITTGGVNIIFTIGPFDEPTWQSIIGAAGGIGSYLISIQPQVQAAIDAHFNLNPAVPPVNNQSPPTTDNINWALKGYFKIVSSGDKPQFVRK